MGLFFVIGSLIALAASASRQRHRTVAPETRYGYGPAGTLQPELDLSSAQAAAWSRGYDQADRDRPFLFSTTGHRQLSDRRSEGPDEFFGLFNEEENRMDFPSFSISGARGLDGSRTGTERYLDRGARWAWRPSAPESFGAWKVGGEGFYPQGQRGLTGHDMQAFDLAWDDGALPRRADFQWNLSHGDSLLGHKEIRQVLEDGAFRFADLVKAAGGRAMPPQSVSIFGQSGDLVGKAIRVMVSPVGHFPGRELGDLAVQRADQANSIAWNHGGRVWGVFAVHDRDKPIYAMYFLDSPEKLRALNKQLGPDAWRWGGARWPAAGGLF